MKKELGTGACSLVIVLLASGWGHSSGLGYFPHMGEVLKIPKKTVMMGEEEEEGSAQGKDEKNTAELKFPTTKTPGQNGAINLAPRRNIILIYPRE